MATPCPSRLRDRFVDTHLYRAESLSLPGMLRLEPIVRRDDRGRLVKLFSEGAFEELGLPVRFSEVFISESSTRVIRGMHFQRPPAAQGKVVSCIAGAALDVALDLRRGSPTFGRHEVVTLTGDAATMVYLPAVMGDHAVMAYLTTSVHDAQMDDGVRWDSIGVAWPYDCPVVSARDRALPALSDVGSPFTFDSAIDSPEEQWSA